MLQRENNNLLKPCIGTEVSAMNWVANALKAIRNQIGIATELYQKREFNSIYTQTDHIQTGSQTETSNIDVLEEGCSITANHSSDYRREEETVPISLLDRKKRTTGFVVNSCQVTHPI